MDCGQYTFGGKTAQASKYNTSKQAQQQASITSTATQYTHLQHKVHLIRTLALTLHLQHAVSLAHRQQHRLSHEGGTGGTVASLHGKPTISTQLLKSCCVAEVTVR